MLSNPSSGSFMKRALGGGGESTFPISLISKMPLSSFTFSKHFFPSLRAQRSAFAIPVTQQNRRLFELTCALRSLWNELAAGGCRGPSCHSNNV